MNYTILIVDDEPCVTEGIILKIKRMKLSDIYEAVTCSSGNQAMALIRERAFDMVITDIRMPFMSGTQFIKELRKCGFTKPILVLSGYDDFEYVREAFVNGANDYMLKPVAIQELEKKLFQYLPQKKQESPLSKEQDGVLPEQEEAESAAYDRIITYAVQYIYDNYKDKLLSMEDVAKHVSVSYGHFSVLFRKETGMTFPSFLRKVRVEKAVELLEDPYLKIADICYQVGYKYPQQFSNEFKRVTGVYPSQYKKRKNEEKEEKEE